MLMFYAMTCKAEITIAVIAPKTGDYEKAGNELFNGAKLAIKEINDNGGLNGEKLDILTIDDRCDDRLAISTAEMLSLLNSKNIGLVIGPYCSNRFHEIADIYEKAKIFQILPTTVYYDTTNEKKGQILLLGTKTQISKDFFQFYNKNYAGLKVGFVYGNKANEQYAEIAKSLYDEFQRYGKKDLLKLYSLNDAEKDVRRFAKSIIKDKVNIVLILGNKDEAVPFIEMLKDRDENMIVFTSKDIFSADLIKKLGKKAEGNYVIELMGLKNSLMFTENLVNLRLLGVEPEGLEVYSYVSVKLWGDLVRQVKSFSYNKLANAVNNGELKEKWSEFLMHSGSMKSSKYIIKIYQNGSFKQVY